MIRRRKFPLPLLNARELLASVPRLDLHLHTQYSDGGCGVAEVFDLARERHLEGIAFTDHARATSTYIPKYIEEIESLAPRYPDLRVFLGLEVKAVNLSGDVDFPELANGRLDLIIGVIHQFPLEPKRPVFGSSRDLAPSHACELEVEASIKMMGSGAIDILGHPTRTFTERYKQPFPYEGLKELVSCASRCGVAVELNARALNLRELLELCLEADCRVSIGSDAHESHEIGAIVGVLEELLRDKCSQFTSPKGEAKPHGMP